MKYALVLFYFHIQNGEWLSKSGMFLLYWKVSILKTNENTANNPKAFKNNKKLLNKINQC